MDKYFLCKEDDEQFIIKAKSYIEAKEQASIYNAVVIRQLTLIEMKHSEPEKGKFAIMD